MDMDKVYFGEDNIQHLDLLDSFDTDGLLKFRVGNFCGNVGVSIIDYENACLLSNQLRHIILKEEKRREEASIGEITIMEAYDKVFKGVFDRVRIYDEDQKQTIFFGGQKAFLEEMKYQHETHEKYLLFEPTMIENRVLNISVETREGD